MADTRLTMFLLLVLCLTYAFERFVLFVFGLEAYAYVFLATLSPSPGWVLAPFAHSVARVDHLLGVASVLVVVGVGVERRLPDPTYLRLFVVAGYASVFAQVATYLAVPAAGTLGASGAVMGLGAFLAVDVTLAAVDGEPVPAVEGALAATALVFVAARVVLDLGIGVDAATSSAPVGHLAGAFVGVAYAVWRAARAGVA